MLWWLLALLLILGLLGTAFFLPVSFNSHAQGRLEPSGTWALALGLGKGPLAMSAVAASGVTPFFTCHLFGRQLLRVPLDRVLSGRASERVPKVARGDSRILRRFRRGLRRLDPVDVWLGWWDKERVFEVSALELDLEYSFRDVALTGQLLAGLCTLSGVLPDRYVIHHTPVWECEDRGQLVADLKFRIWPGRLFVDVLEFVLNQWRLGGPPAAPASQ